MELQINAKQNNSYKVMTAENFELLPLSLEELFPEAKQVLILTDSNVEKLHKKDLVDYLDKKYNVLFYSVKAGEASKNIDYVFDVIKYLVEKDFSREDVIIGLGGGVVCDLAGFIASLYHRGVGHVLLPTTLLAMADASVGGKTAVDYEGLKNIVGAFKMPSLVYMNLETLKTLPEREYYAGFAEIMKAALLNDAEFYMWLIENMYEICDKDKETLSSMLEKSLSIKKAIVEKDPFDKGDRALLNLGHTIGHAIESYFNGEYLHGEAVALGCVAAAYISWKSDMIGMEDYYEVRDMFVPFNLPISIMVDEKALDEIASKVKKDKKNTKDSINMVLLKKIGKAVLVKDISMDLVKEALKELNFTEED